MRTLLLDAEAALEGGSEAVHGLPRAADPLAHREDRAPQGLHTPLALDQLRVLQSRASSARSEDMAAAADAGAVGGIGRNQRAAEGVERGRRFAIWGLGALPPL
jgi:hypothetical protein